MPEFIDQIDHAVLIERTPRRIISLVPSQTELLFDLGLREEVAGITKFCVHPRQWFTTKPRVGGTKQLKMDIIRQLNPDLIIANKEENVKEQVKELQKHYAVWTSDVNSLTDACEMIKQVGMITGKAEPSSELISTIRARFSKLIAPASPIPACYLIWQDPFMTIGGDTFIHAMMEAAGFRNLFSEYRRYPVINAEQLQALDPALVLLSSEPFPFAEKHKKEIQALLPAAKILLADGEMFSWYGSRLLHAPKYFTRLQEQLKIEH